MTKKTDSGEVIQIRSRDLMRTPLGVLLTIAALAGGGTGGVSLLNVASKTDVAGVEQHIQRVESKQAVIVLDGSVFDTNTLIVAYPTQ